MRKDKVLQIVEEFSTQYKLKDIQRGVNGITSYEIANIMHIARNNTSSDLNELWKEGKIIKITGNKKFEFFSQRVFSALTGIKLGVASTCESLSSLTKKSVAFNKLDDPFENLIGAHESLKNAIISAKASVLYPGGTLHTLLLGESGVGKSLFARTMYQFGVNEHVYKDTAKFVVFNCADYANNVELLLSQLFGSVKGAYTGAEQTREGLISRADGGVLFLDEVHRLPPEGQEMLFYLIDTGKYRMLGESGVEHQANVSLIMATTENPDNHLLTTFMRRIPMVINIPNLEKKSVEEKKELIMYLYNMEAIATQMAIHIDRDTLLSLIFYNPPGNIGQLKNDVRLSVARSYLEQKKDTLTELNVHLYSLSQMVQSNFDKIDSKTKETYIHQIVKDTLYVPPYPYLYHEIDSFFPTAANERKQIDIKSQFETYVQQILMSLDDSTHSSFIIDDDIQSIMSFVREWILYHMNFLLERSQNASFAFYLKSIRDHSENNLNFILDENSEEMVELSRNLVREIECRFHFQIPENQIKTIASILDTFKNHKPQNSKMKMLVLAHGDSLASNIANVVNELLNGSFLTPINMPLSRDVNDVINEVIDNINKEPEDCDIILFVDMGSLANMEKILSEKISQKVFVIPTVNTLVLLESVRKVTYLNYTTEAILNDIIRISQKMNHNLEHQIKGYIEQYTERIIYTICRSGEGTARYLETYLKQIFEKNNIFDIDIVSLSYDSPQKIKKIIRETSKNKDVLCIIGNVNLDTNEYPFISLEDILMRDGVSNVFKLIGHDYLIVNDKMMHAFKRNVFVDVSLESVQKYLLYLDAQKISPIVLEFIEKVEKESNQICENNILIRLVIHICCMIERLLFDEYVASNNDAIDENELMQIIKKNIHIIENAFNIKVSQGECEFIREILQDN